MLRIRIFDEQCVRMAKYGQIVGDVHTTIGQEATVVGACLALTGEDRMTGNHRSHGHPIAKGANLGPLMAEILGKETGICKGRGGSLHLADFSVGSLGESGIVGGAMPLAVGAALSAVVKGGGQVCLSFFGDGASTEGVFHESLNLSAVWKLPVIWLCENNGYAVSLPQQQQMPLADVAAHASGYGIPGKTVDGQDVVAVYDLVTEAVARARAGEGPSLIEAKTFRFRPHSEGLGFIGRDDEELAQWMNRDPIGLHRDRMLADGFDAAELDDIRAEVMDEVNAAVQFAQASPDPCPADLFRDLYAQPVDASTAGRRP